MCGQAVRGVGAISRYTARWFGPQGRKRNFLLAGLVADMATLGIIGSGKIGSTVARLAVEAGIDVVLSNSRDPETLADLVAELGPRARAATPAEAAEAGDWVLLSVPYSAYKTLPAEQLAGKVVLDAVNYASERDGRIPALDNGQITSSFLQDHLPQANVVKAFSSIACTHLRSLARPAGAPDRSALPIAADDSSARASAAGFIDRIGYDTVDAGPLDESWRMQQWNPVFVMPYVTGTYPPLDLDDPGVTAATAAIRTALGQAVNPAPRA
jgi:predicted dinucleotide-binding enzyme